jgi:hypothetical protein
LAAAAVLSAALFAAPAAHAASAHDPNGFHFSQSHYYVDENAGQAVITVERTDTAKAAEVQFITTGETPHSPTTPRPRTSSPR